MTVQEAHAMFMTDIVEVQRQRQSTIAAHRSLMRMLIEVAPEMRDITDITTDVLLRFFHWGTRARGWSAVTLDTHQRRLHCFLGWVVRERLLPTNPMANISKPKMPRRSLRSLRQNQAAQILEAAPLVAGDAAFIRTRASAIVAVFLFAGLRKSELLHLTVNDVDLRNKVLTVLEGKGGKDRHIPISPALAMHLVPYVAERARAGKSTWAFFASDTHDTPLADMTLRRLVGRIRAHVGFSFGLHMLRHTFATLMIEGGCDIYALSEMMGHSDIRTTTLYLSNTVEHLRAQVSLHPLGSLAAQPLVRPPRWRRPSPRHHAWSADRRPSETANAMPYSMPHS